MSLNRFWRQAAIVGSVVTFFGSSNLRANDLHLRHQVAVAIDSGHFDLAFKLVRQRLQRMTISERRGDNFRSFAFLLLQVRQRMLNRLALVYGVSYPPFYAMTLRDMEYWIRALSPQNPPFVSIEMDMPDRPPLVRFESERGPQREDREEEGALPSPLFSASLQPLSLFAAPPILDSVRELPPSSESRVVPESRGLTWRKAFAGVGFLVMLYMIARNPRQPAGKYFPFWLFTRLRFQE